MNYEIVNLEEKKLLGKEIKVTKEFQKEEGIRKFWKEFMDNIDFDSYKESFGISKNWDQQTQEFTYIIALNEGIIINKEGMSEYIISSGKYMKFSYKGVFEQDKLEKLYNEAFGAVNNGVETFDETRGINCFELYNEDFINPEDPASIFYLLIPVK